MQKQNNPKNKTYGDGFWKYPGSTEKFGTYSPLILFINLSEIIHLNRQQINNTFLYLKIDNFAIFMLNFKIQYYSFINDVIWKAKLHCKPFLSGI